MVGYVQWTPDEKAAFEEVLISDAGPNFRGVTQFRDAVVLHFEQNKSRGLKIRSKEAIGAYASNMAKKVNKSMEKFLQEWVVPSTAPNGRGNTKPGKSAIRLRLSTSPPTSPRPTANQDAHSPASSTSPPARKTQLNTSEKQGASTTTDDAEDDEVPAASTSTATTAPAAQAPATQLPAPASTQARSSQPTVNKVVLQPWEHQLIIRLRQGFKECKVDYDPYDIIPDEQYLDATLGTALQLIDEAIGCFLSAYPIAMVSGFLPAE